MENVLEYVTDTGFVITAVIGSIVAVLYLLFRKRGT
ncbi:EYxxD motif small membrane protein [Thalassobacillus hwangdonensis]|uniref:EYxxD motif small membrane protein n=1 Tax=Thalassobacillus hwangdonensis TaxID=546108 RepID=A0ABW3L4P1_9BACI